MCQFPGCRIQTIVGRRRGGWCAAASPIGFDLRLLLSFYVYVQNVANGLGVADVYARDLSVFDFHGSGIGSFLVDHMVPVGFDVLAEQFLPVLMVHLGRRNRGICKGEQADNDNYSAVRRRSIRLMFMVHLQF